MPGHEDFVKNMVAGVGSIDLSLLVVAADDGWMPQTEEHLQILTYLGVKRAVVALTKIDLAQNEQSTVAAIREQIEGHAVCGRANRPHIRCHWTGNRRREDRSRASSRGRASSGGYWQAAPAR